MAITVGLNVSDIGCMNYLIPIGSMVLYMVCHGSHQYTPVMLAYTPWSIWDMDVTRSKSVSEEIMGKVDRIPEENTCFAISAAWPRHLCDQKKAVKTCGPCKALLGKQ